MKKSKFYKLIDFFRVKASDYLTSAVATWAFVLTYTFSILFWIVLHKIGILQIDSSFLYCGFFLSWLSGIQASIIMMSDGRKEEKHFADTERDLENSEKVLEAGVKSKELIKKMTDKFTTLSKKIEKLDEIINLMEKEEQENLNEKISKRKTKPRNEN